MRRIVPLAVVLAFVMPIVLSAAPVNAQTPPQITSATVERTTLFRGLQTLRATFAASDKETPPIGLVGITEITFADFQKIVVEPMPRVLDARGRPTGPFVLVLPIPESVGTGAARLTFTVIDGENLTATISFDLTILDHRPIVATREDAQFSIITSESIIAAYKALGINVASAEDLLQEAKDSFDEGNFLLGLEDVEAAVAKFEIAADRADLALDRANSDASAFALARDAMTRAQIAIERARAFITAWGSLGVDVSEAQGLLADAEESFNEGVDLMKVEGVPGASSAFVRAETLAMFAIDSVEGFIEVWRAEQDRQAFFEEVKASLDQARVEFISVKALVDAVRATGVDASRPLTLLNWAEGALNELSRRLTVADAPAVKESLDFVLAQLSKAREEAENVLASHANDLISRARLLLDSVKGAPLAPDTSLAEALIESAQKALDEGEHFLSISRSEAALTELARLEGVAFTTTVTLTGSILAIIIAIILGVALIRRRGPLPS